MVLKGVPIRTAADFSAFVSGTGYTPLTSGHGVSERQQYADNVFGASDDVPKDFTLAPHNEQ
eukprot:gene48281-30518_t